MRQIEVEGEEEGGLREEKEGGGGVKILAISGCGNEVIPKILKQLTYFLSRPLDNFNNILSPFLRF